MFEMITLKTNALKYKKPDGSMSDIGVVAGGQIVDNTLSATSENPVQNKVVTEEIGKLSEEIVEQLDGKQPKGDYALKSDIPVEGVYELIETITLEEDAIIRRTQETNGTPYKFSRLLIKMETNAASVVGANWNAKNAGTQVALMWINGLSNIAGTANAVFEVRKDCGYWRCLALMWNTNPYSGTYYENVYSFRNSKRVEDYPYIDEFGSSAAMPKGTVLYVWAVRA